MATLTKNIVRNRKKILEGVSNYIKKDVNVEAIAQKRLLLCENCQKNDNGTCSICGCILKLKTRSMASSCPLDEIGEEKLWDSVEK